MHHPFITGEKIYLRGLEKEDFTERLLRWRNDPEVTCLLEQGVFPSTQEVLEEEYEQLVRSKNDAVFAIVDKQTDTHIGLIGLYLINWIARHAECITMIGEKDFWGKGCGNEAMELIIGYGFDKLNLNKICAGVNAEIVPALKYCERIGFKREGLRRQEVYRNGKYYDAWILSVFREEFYEAMEKLKEKK